MVNTEPGEEMAAAKAGMDVKTARKYLRRTPHALHSCEMLVQHLLIAKRDLKLSRLIQRYARYEGMIIDDLGYIRQTREEIEVVVTLLQNGMSAAACC